jgi:hypothetical protein
MDTMRVSCESVSGDYMEGTVPVGTDLDGAFSLKLDNGERVRVNGWVGSVEEITA